MFDVFFDQNMKIALEIKQKSPKIGWKWPCGPDFQLFQLESAEITDFRRRSSTKTALTFGSEEISPSNFCCEYPSIVAINSTIVGGNQKKSRIYRSKKPRKTRKTSILRRNQDFSNRCISESRSAFLFLIFLLRSPSNLDQLPCQTWLIPRYCKINSYGPFS